MPPWEDLLGFEVDGEDEYSNSEEGIEVVD